MTTKARHNRQKRALERFKLTISPDTKYRLGNEGAEMPNLGAWLQAKMQERSNLDSNLASFSPCVYPRQRRTPA